MRFNMLTLALLALMLVVGESAKVVESNLGNMNPKEKRTESFSGTPWPRNVRVRLALDRERSFRVRIKRGDGTFREIFTKTNGVFVYEETNAGDEVEFVCETSGTLHCAGSYIVTVFDCSPCPQGTYLPQGKECSFADGRDRTCNTCPSGYICPAGTTHNTLKTCKEREEPDKEEGSFACRRCSEGYVKQVPHKGFCERCSDGTIEKDNYWCTSCSAGTRSGISEGINACLDCKAGETSSERSPACTPCEPGTFSPTPKSPSCTECPVNTYQDQPGQISCKTCPDGRTTFGKTGLSSCDGCPPGFLCIDATTTEICPVGKACSDNKATLCNTGKYQDQPGQAECKVAPPGSFVPADPSKGFTTATPCQAGFYSEKGWTSCKKCENGFQPRSGQGQCMECPPGTFFNSAIEEECVECPPMFFPTTATRTRETCAPLEKGGIVDSETQACADNINFPMIYTFFVKDLANATTEAETLAMIDSATLCIDRFLAGARAGDTNRFFGRFFGAQMDDLADKLTTRMEAALDESSFEVATALARLIGLFKLYPRDEPCARLGTMRIDLTNKPGVPLTVCEVKAFHASGDPVTFLHASQSSTQGNHLAKLAIDQRTDTFLGSAANDPVCALTNSTVDGEQGGAWMEVVYVQRFDDPVKRIQVWSRSDEQGANDILGATLFVLGNEVGTFSARASVRAAFEFLLPIAQAVCTTPPASATSTFVPPAPQQRFNVPFTTGLASISPEYRNLDLTTYMDTFTGENLFKLCVSAAASIDCPPGSVRNLPISSSSSCENVALEHYPTRFVAHAFCTLAQGLEGSSTALSILNHAHQSALALMWLERDQRAAIHMLRTINAIQNEAGTVFRAGSDTDYISKFVHMGLLTSQTTTSLSRAIGFLDEFNTETVAEVGSVCRSTGCPGSLQIIQDNLSTERIVQEIKSSYAQLAQGITSSFEGLRSQIQSGFNGQQLILTSLADLFVNVQGAALNGTAQALLDLASTHNREAESALLLAQEEFLQTRNLFNGIMIRIQDENSNFQGVYEEMQGYSALLANTTTEFYQCRKEEELAKIARARVTAVLDVIQGAVLIGMDIASFVVSGGSSSAAKAGGKAAAKGTAKAKGKLGKKFRRKPTKSKGIRPGKKKYDFDSFKEDYGDSLAKQFTPDQIGKIREQVEKGVALWSDIPELDDVAGIVDFVQGNLEILGAVGVPCMDGAAMMLGGIYALVDEAAQQQQAEDAANQGLNAANQTFAQLAAMVNELSETSALLLLEFYDVVCSQSPPDGVSVVDSTSPTIWRDIEKLVVSFLETSEMYYDFTAATRGERLLLSNDDSQQENSLSLTSRMRERSLQLVSDAPEVEFRRSLNEKKGCPEVTSFATTGLELLESYKFALNRAVTFGEGMHLSMMEFVRTARTMSVNRLKLKLAQENVNTWKQTQQDMELAKNTALDGMTSFHSRFRSTVESVRILVPELQIKAGAAIVDVLGELTSSEGVLTGACSQTWFFALVRPDLCFPDAAGVTTQDELGDYFASLKTEISQTIGQTPVPAEDWIRVPLYTALSIASTNNNTEITGTDVVSVDLAKRAPRGCGTNAELVAMGVVLEDLADDDKPVMLPEWTDGEFSTFSIKPSGPFLKYDSNGFRHLFLIDTVRETGGERLFVTSGRCSDVTEASVHPHKLPSGYSLCVRAHSEAIDPVPAFGKYSVQLGPLAQIINARANEPRLQLSLYLKVRAIGFDRNTCVFENQLLQAIGSEPTSNVANEEDSDNWFLQNKDLLIYIGAGVGGLLVLSTIVLVVRRRRANKKQQQGALVAVKEEI